MRTPTPHNARLLALLAASACSFALLLDAGHAHAQSAAKMKEQVQAYTLKLADLEKEDVEKGAIQELKLTQLWLNEAQAQLVKEEEDAAGRYLRRVEISVEMIAALIEQAKAERAANDRESVAIKLKNDMNQAKVELEQVEARKRTLLNETAAPAGGKAP